MVSRFLWLVWRVKLRTPSPLFFVITDKTLQAVEKLVDSLKKLGIKYVDGELVYYEEEAGYNYLY